MRLYMSTDTILLTAPESTNARPGTAPRNTELNFAVDRVGLQLFETWALGFPPDRRRTRRPVIVEVAGQSGTLVHSVRFVRSGGTLLPEFCSCQARAANCTAHTHLRVAASSVVSAPVACIFAAAVVVHTAVGRTAVAVLAV